MWRPGTPALSFDSGKPKCCPTGHRRQEARGEIFARRRPETPVGLRPPSVPGRRLPSHPDCRASLILIVAPQPRPRSPVSPSPCSASPPPHGCSPRATASSDGRRDSARRTSPSSSTTRDSSSCPGSISSISAGTSLPSPADYCPRTGRSDTTTPPCSSRPSSKRRATPAPSTGPLDGPMSAPPVGRERHDREKQFDKPRKDIWLRPLRRDWQRTLNRQNLPYRTARHGSTERVWTPPLMQAVFGRLGACGQVLSCVRPLYAADDTPRARMEMRGLGPNRLRELESSPFGCWFSRPGLVDLCPYLSSVLPTSPTASRTSPFSQAVAGAR